MTLVICCYPLPNSPSNSRISTYSSPPPTPRNVLIGYLSANRTRSVYSVLTRGWSLSTMYLIPSLPCRFWNNLRINYDCAIPSMQQWCEISVTKANNESSCGYLPHVLCPDKLSSLINYSRPICSLVYSNGLPYWIWLQMEGLWTLQEGKVHCDNVSCGIYSILYSYFFISLPPPNRFFHSFRHATYWGP